MVLFCVLLLCVVDCVKELVNLSIVFVQRFSTLHLYQRIRINLLTLSAQNIFMFNRYWRSYPWFFQLVQFIILIIVLASFFIFALTPVVLNVMKVSMNEIIGMSAQSARKVIDAALVIQFFTAIGIFLFPVLLFAYFTHPRPAKYLGLVKPGKPLQWILSPLLILSATPLLLFIAELISHIDFGTSVKQAQELNDKTFKAMLQMSSPIHLFFALVVLAILPGLSEELFFPRAADALCRKEKPPGHFPFSSFGSIVRIDAF